MLRDEVTKYTELTGEDGNHTPIMKIGAYLDGYEKGLSTLDKIRAEIADLINDDDKFDEFSYGDADCDEYYKAVLDALEIIDKYN